MRDVTQQNVEGRLLIGGLQQGRGLFVFYQ